MAKMKFDYSECSIEAIPEHIIVVLPNGVVMNFQIPKMTSTDKKESSKAPVEESFKAPVKVPFKAPFKKPFKKHDDDDEECHFGLFCRKFNCRLIHPDIEDEKQAVFDGSPEDVQDAIYELFEKLDEKRLKVFLHAIKNGFKPYQSTCNFRNNCINDKCARIHNEYDLKGISQETINAIANMDYSR